MAKKKKDEKKEKAKAALKLASAGYIGQQTLRSGLPRALGVRLESHSTSRKNAKSILKNGGILDPNKGGAGASSNHHNKTTSDTYKNNSSKYVHITGKHKNGYEALLGIEVGKGLENNPVSNTISTLGRNLQRPMYRMFGSGKPSFIGAVESGLGIRGRTLYTGGTDKFFNENFIPDTDDLALKSSKPVRVYGNRLSATGAAIKKEGLINLVKANKSRVATGGAILALGGYATQKLARDGFKQLSDGKVKPHTRKTKSGVSRVKGYKKDV
jgi:hypothetical protein